jgi:alkylation response protein AidB-like acyl-CoA dehydrogenase
VPLHPAARYVAVPGDPAQPLDRVEGPRLAAHGQVEATVAHRQAIQIHGGMGETDWLPLTRFYHVAQHARIGGGTDEVHKMVLARYLLGRSGER